MGTASRKSSRAERASTARLESLQKSTDPRNDEILRAAFDAFIERGFHGTTMLDVASRARASKATLYARFESKEVLFRALMAWATRQGTDALDAIAHDETLDPRTALDCFAIRLLTHMMQPEKLALFRIAVAEGERLPEVGRIFSSLTRDHGRGAGRVLAARLIAHGIIAIDDPDDYGNSFIGLLQGELYTQALLGIIPPPGSQAIEKHARRAMARLVRAFAPPRPRAPIKKP